LNFARVCLGVPKAEDGRIALRFCCSGTIEQTQEHQVYNGKNPLRSSSTTTTTWHEKNQKLYRKRIKDSKTHKPTHNGSISSLLIHTHDLTLECLPIYAYDDMTLLL
jgi:hypothetical protein